MLERDAAQFTHFNLLYIKYQWFSQFYRFSDASSDVVSNEDGDQTIAVRSKLSSPASQLMISIYHKSDVLFLEVSMCSLSHCKHSSTAAIASQGINF